MEIYMDILILENIVINYLILVVTAKFSKSKTSSLRLFLGCTCRSIICYIHDFLPDMKIYTTVLAKIILSFVIIAVTFKSEKLVTFFKTLAMFYVSTFIFAGAGFALLYFNQNGGFVRNGVMMTIYLPFLDTKWTQILLALAVAGIIIRVFWEIIQ